MAERKRSMYGGVTAVHNLIFLLLAPNRKASLIASDAPDPLNSH